MKHLLVFLTISLAAYASSAHPLCGIYISATDYNNNRPAYSTECSTAANHIHLHDFFWSGSTVTFTSAGKHYKLKKCNLFGYRDRYSNFYRFYNNEAFRLAEEGCIYIYTQTRNVTQLKGFTVTNDYYFSITLEGPIIPLSYNALLACYTDNPDVTGLIEQYFPNRNVAVYDINHKMYRINYILQMLLQRHK